MEEIKIKLMTSCFNIMLNYRLSQKFILLGNDKFSHLTIILTLCIIFPSFNLEHPLCFGLHSKSFLHLNEVNIHHIECTNSLYENIYIIKLCSQFWCNT